MVVIMEKIICNDIQTITKSAQLGKPKEKIIEIFIL